MENNINKETAIKDFKAVQFMRNVSDKISNDTIDMDFEQIKKYFKDRKLKLAEK